MAEMYLVKANVVQCKQKYILHNDAFRILVSIRVLLIHYYCITLHEHKQDGITQTSIRPAQSIRALCHRSMKQMSLSADLRLRLNLNGVHVNIIALL